jgi:hypothetical protein
MGGGGVARASNSVARSSMAMDKELAGLVRWYDLKKFCNEYQLFVFSALAYSSLNLGFLERIKSFMSDFSSDVRNPCWCISLAARNLVEMIAPELERFPLAPAVALKFAGGGTAVSPPCLPLPIDQGASGLNRRESSISPIDSVCCLELGWRGGPFPRNCWGGGGESRSNGRPCGSSILESIDLKSKSTSKSSCSSIFCYSSLRFPFPSLSLSLGAFRSIFYLFPFSAGKFTKQIVELTKELSTYTQTKITILIIQNC